MSTITSARLFNRLAQLTNLTEDDSKAELISADIKRGSFLDIGIILECLEDKMTEPGGLTVIKDALKGYETINGQSLLTPALWKLIHVV